MGLNRQPEYKNKWIKLESIQLNEAYSFTFNPKGQPDSISDIKVWYRRIYDIFHEYQEAIKLQLYVESSPSGRLHFHGLIWVLDLYQFLAFIWKVNDSGASEMDTLSTSYNSEEFTLSEWCIYMKKQEHVFKDQFVTNVIGYPLVIDKNIDVVKQPLTINHGWKKNNYKL